jgi:hypothetical protein
VRGTTGRWVDGAQIEIEAQVRRPAQKRAL